MHALLAIFLSLLLAACAPNRDFSGEVVEITDGDTLTVRTPANEEIVVRLAEIDAPERGQPYAAQSGRALASLALHEPVTVRYFDTDAYRRTVGRVYTGTTDVSAEMVRSGLAWVYRQYVRDEILYDLEDEAREGERGLWAAREHPIPPWEWRRGARPTPVPAETAAAPFTCGAKRYCREMASCEEARFYREQCDVTTIDGDDDGIPCEAICR